MVEDIEFHVRRLFPLALIWVLSHTLQLPLIKHGYNELLLVGMFARIDIQDQDVLYLQ